MLEGWVGWGYEKVDGWGGVPENGNNMLFVIVSSWINGWGTVPENRRNLLFEIVLVYFWVYYFKSYIWCHCGVLFGR